MVKQTPEEIRREVLEEDAKKDVSIYLSISIGVAAGVSATAAICAVITMRALVYFRTGVDAQWLTCVPFLFPVISGLFAAYKKQFALLGVHLSVNLLALLLGGFGFGLSVEPIFINRRQCVRVHENVPCAKDSLAYLYMVSGALAAGFAVIGFLLTVGGLQSASKRIANRVYQAHLQHRWEQEQKQKELRQMKMQNEGRSRALSVSVPANTATDTVNTPAGGAPAANGGPQTLQGQGQDQSEGQASRPEGVKDSEGASTAVLP